MFSSILLIDDSEIDLFISSKVIEASGLCQRVVPIRNPLRALDYLRSFRQGPSQQAEPDLILLDIDMPFLNGFEFLEELESHLPGEIARPCVVMLSSTLDERDVARARKHWSVLRFLSKPLTIEALELIAVHTRRWPMAGLSMQTAA